MKLGLYFDTENCQNNEQATLMAVVGEWQHKDDNNGSQKSINKSEDRFEDYYTEEGTTQDIVTS